MRKFLFIVLFAIFVFGGVAYFFRGKISMALLEFSKAQLPSVTKAEVLASLASRDSATSGDLAGEIPTSDTSDLAFSDNHGSINLDVPFSSQAPLKDWGMPYQEACEEMSAILVNEFYQSGKTLAEGKNRPDEIANNGDLNDRALDSTIADEAINILDAVTANQAVQKLVAWEQANFGFYKHTTVADTARILREYFGFERVEVQYDITLQDLKREVAAGRPVIVPLAGRKVGNIYYRRPGPIYHMLVVRGFTDDGRIITNDVGTQHGENYPYDEEIFFNAIHDALSSGDGTLTEEEIERGSKAMIVVEL